MTPAQRALAIVALGFLASFLQPTMSAGRDLRFDAIASLVDEERSFLGDPGPSIMAARAHLRDPRAALYQTDLSGGSAFIYPPIAAKPYEPLAHLRAEDARATLSVASRALWVAIVALLVALLTLRRGLRPLEVALAIAGPVLFFPLVHAVQLNQATLAVTALVGGAFISLQSDRRVLAGVLFGAASAIKPQLALLLPLLVFHARATVVSALATGAAFFGASLAYAGWANHVTYASHVLPTLSRGYAYFANQSVNGLLQRLFVETDIGVFRFAPPSTPVRVLTALIALGAYGAAFELNRRLPRRADLAPLVLSFSWLVCTMISPIAWQHHYAPALFVIVLLHREARRELYVPCALAFVLLATYFEVRMLRGPVARVLVSQVFFGAAALLFAVVRALRLRASADTA